MRELKATIKVEALEETIRGIRELKDLTAQDLTVKVNVEAEDPSRTLADLKSQAERTKPKVTVEASLKDAQREVAGFSRQLSNLKGRPNIDDSELRELERRTKDLDALLNQLDGDVDVDAGDLTTVSRLTKSLATDFKQAERAADQFEAEVRASERATNLLREQAVKAAKVFATAFTVRGIGNFVRDAINDASDWTETLNVAQATLGDLSDEAVRFAQAGDEAFGVTTEETLRLTASLSGMGRNFGLAQDDALDFGKTLVQIGADVGSFRNANTQDVIQAFSAALRGETEAARRYNVFVDQARVNQVALERGFADSTDEIDKQARALATLEIIQQDTANATGDFARTLGESLPNQTKVLRAELENLRGDIGEQFREPFLDAVKQVRDQIPGLREEILQIDFGEAFGDGLEAGLVLLRQLVAVGPDLLSVASTLLTTTGNLATVLATLFDLIPGGVIELAALAGIAQKVGGAFGGLETSGGKAAAGVFLVVDAVSRLTDESADTEDKLLGIAEAAAAGGIAFGPWGAAAGAAAAAAVALVSAFTGPSALDQQLESVSQGTDAYADALREAGPPHEALRAEIEPLIEEYNRLAEATGQGVNAAAQIDELTALGKAYAAYDDDTKDLVDGFIDLVGGTDEFLEGLARASEDGIPRFRDANGDAFNAFSEYIGLLGQGSDDAKVFGQVFSDLATAQFENAEANEAAAKAAFDNAFATDAYSISVRDAARQLEEAGFAGDVWLTAQRQVNDQLTAAEAKQEAYYQNFLRINEVTEFATRSTDELAQALIAAPTNAEVFAEVLGTAGQRAGELIAALQGGEQTLPQLAALQDELGLSTEQLAIAQGELANRLADAETRIQENIDLIAGAIPTIAGVAQGLPEESGVGDFLQSIITEQQEFLAFQSNLSTLIAAGADDLVATLAQIPDAAQAARFAQEATDTLVDGEATEATAALEAQAEQIRLGFEEAKAAAVKGGEELSAELQTGLGFDGEAVPDFDIEVGVGFAEGAVEDVDATLTGFTDTTVTPTLELDLGESPEVFDNYVLEINETIATMTIEADTTGAYASVNELLAWIGQQSAAVTSGAGGGIGGTVDARHGLITRTPTYFYSNGQRVRSSEHFHKELFVPIVPTHKGRKEAFNLAERSGLLDLIDPYLEKGQTTVVAPTQQAAPSEHTTILQVTQAMPATSNPDAALAWWSDDIRRHLAAGNRR